MRPIVVCALSGLSFFRGGPTLRRPRRFGESNSRGAFVNFRLGAFNQHFLAEEWLGRGIAVLNHSPAQPFLCPILRHSLLNDVKSSLAGLLENDTKAEMFTPVGRPGELAK